MYPVKSSAARSTLEEMLDSIRTGDEEQGDMPPALPQRPTSRARLPSSVRARKHLGAAMDSLTLPSKGPTVLLKENVPVDSPIANLVLPRGPSAVPPETLNKLQVSYSRPLDNSSTTDSSSRFTQESCRTENGNDMYTLNNRSELTLQNAGSQSMVPGIANGPEARVCMEGSTEQHSRDPRDVSEAIGSGLATAVPTLELENSSFSFASQQGPALHTPVEETPAPVVTPLTTGKKWKDDGTLRLKKVSFVQVFLLCVYSRVANFCWNVNCPVILESKREGTSKPAGQYQ